MLFVCHSKILHKHCLQFLLGVKMAPRETENNAYAKFWGDKERALWYVMVFSGVVRIFSRRSYMKMEFSSQRRDMLLFLTTNTGAVAHVQTSNYWVNCMIFIPFLGEETQERWTCRGVFPRRLNSCCRSK